MQSLHCQTLLLSVKINGRSAHWNAATTDTMQGVESTLQHGRRTVRLARLYMDWAC